MRTVHRFTLLVAILLALAVGTAPTSDARRGVPSRSRTSPDPTAYGPPARVAGGEAAVAAGPSVSEGGSGSGGVTWGAALPLSTFGFDAIPRVGGSWPADPTGAVGDGWFFVAANTSYALYDLAGTPALGPEPLDALFRLPSGTKVFDPRVVYDPYEDTFVLAFVGTNERLEKAWVLVVVIPSTTANDVATWCRSEIAADRTSGDGRQWVDYPGIGFDRDRVVISTNRFDFAAGEEFRGAQVLSFPKARLYDCARSLTFATFLGNDTLNPDGTPAFTIQPAVSAGPTPRAQYLLSFEEGRPNYVVVWRLKEGSSGPRLTRAAIEVNRVGIAPYGTQGDGSLDGANTWWDPGDLRLVTAFYDGDRDLLYAAHAIARDLKPDTVTDGYVESAIRWYELRPAAELSASDVTRFGTLGAPETDAGWPALATDAAGNLFVTFSRAGAATGEYLSAWVAEIAPGSTRANLLLLAAGTARIEAIRGVERWGDYSSVSRDPVAGAYVVVVNQYAPDDGGATTLDWQQSVHVVLDA